MKYLIVDLNIELNGHKFAFVNELMKWIELNGRDLDEFHFLVNLDHTKFHKSERSNIVVVEPCSPRAIDWENEGQLKKYQLQWAYILKASHALMIDRLVLMEFDLYQAEIGKSSVLSFEVHGIWFRPFVRQKCFDPSKSARVKFAINLFKKKRLFDWAMRNKSVSKVFVLNDQYTVDVLNGNKKFRNRMAYLPDPVFDVTKDKSIDIKKLYEIADNQFIILIFGCIDDRKNVINSLSALENLSQESQEKVTLLIVGKVMDSYRDEMETKIKELNDSRKFGLIVKDEFVDDVEMDALFQQSDLVLRMNINYFASSGIIGMSAKYKKPSIVSNYGIVADITTKYKLGTLVDPLNVSEIKQAIDNFIAKNEGVHSEGDLYYKEHNCEAYARALLSL